MKALSRLQKRRTVLEIALSILVVCLAMGIGSLLVLAIGKNPIEVFAAMFQSSLGSPKEAAFTLSISAPLLITSIGMLIAFKAGMWNVGGEGQIYLGALAGLILSAELAKMHVSTLLVLPLICLAAFCAGGCYAALAGALKVMFRVDEIVSTLMLTFIATYVMIYLVRVPYRDQYLSSIGGTGIQSFRISESGMMPTIYGINIALFLGIAIAIIVHFLTTRTVFGFRLTLVGENTATARYSGVDVRRYSILSMFVSGGLAGLGGIAIVSGYTYFVADGITQSFGYVAMAVVFLANLNAIAIIPVSIFFGILYSGGIGIMTKMGIPSVLSATIAAVAIIFVTIRSGLMEKAWERLRGG